MDRDRNARLNRKWNCRLTTVGRKSGQPRTVTLWFVLDGDAAYLAGGKQDPQWCRNIRVNGEVTLEIAGTRLPGIARIVEDPGEARTVRERFVRKYLLARLSRPFGGYTRSVPVVVRLRDA